MRFPIRICTLNLFLVYLLTACVFTNLTATSTLSGPEQVPIASIEITSTPTYNAPSNIDSTYTPIPTITNSSTSQIEASFTPSPTENLPTTTSLPLETLTVSEGEQEVENLISSNTNCKLPCWWNFYPNKTSWYEVSNFLTYLGRKYTSQKLQDSTTYHGSGIEMEQTYFDLGFNTGKKE